MNTAPLFGSVAILAGGKSSRMGFDKQLLTVNQRSLIEITIKKLHEIFNDIIIVTATPHYYQSMSVTTVCDNYPDMGPLAGIEAALSVARSEYLFVMACDMPNFCAEYALKMQHLIVSAGNPDTCITKHGDWIEPFHAYYGKSSYKQLSYDLSHQKGSIFYFLKSVDTLYVDEHIAREYNPRMDMFANLNTRHDYEAYLQKTLG